MDEEECEDCEEGAPAWMATFSDMATLLLTFFVLLLSFANMDVQNFKVALGSVKEALGVQDMTKGDFEARSSSLVELNDDAPTVMVNHQSANEVHLLRKYIKERGMQHHIQVMASSTGIILRVKDIALFDTGSDALREDSEPVLNMVQDLFEKSQADLSIDGHTDDIPIASARFPSNWELSAARAAAVLKYYLARDLAGRRLSIAGYGELRPIATNQSAEGRGKNRRVEFVFRRQSDQQGPLFDLEGNGSPSKEPDKAGATVASDQPARSQGPDGKPAVDKPPKGKESPAAESEAVGQIDEPRATTKEGTASEAAEATDPKDGSSELPSEESFGPKEWTGPNMAEQARGVEQQEWNWD